MSWTQSSFPCPLDISSKAVKVSLFIIIGGILFLDFLHLQPHQPTEEKLWNALLSYLSRLDRLAGDVDHEFPMNPIYRFLPVPFFGGFIGVGVTAVVWCAFNTVSEKSIRYQHTKYLPAILSNIPEGVQNVFLIGESLYGLNKLFPNPFSIVDVGAMSDTPMNLKHRVSWPVISSNFARKAHVDHRQNGPPWLIESIDRQSDTS
ncbi:hypothetical protein Tco_0697444 [Tanacetum coccineum]